MAFSQYVYKNKQRLRCGYTTGTCAALAAKAAAQLLLTGQADACASVLTPGGVPVEAEILHPVLEQSRARCAVQKDSGDDPDVTNGMLVYATVEKTTLPGIVIDGGEGVGRVTRRGLDQPVGAAAINSVPRRFIEQEVKAACEEAEYYGGLRVVLSVPGGAEIAKKTFNPRLGIEGGISILGTSGIVEPMSQQAIVDSIRIELSRLRADGMKSVVITPGNYGDGFLQKELAQLAPKAVKCSNFLGETVDNAAALGFEQLLLVGHIGKLIKLAGGIMNTHSSYADARLELMTAHAALCGADTPTVRALMESATTDEGIETLQKSGILAPTMASLMEKLHSHLQRRSGETMQAEAVMFSNVHGVLGSTPGASGLIERIAEEMQWYIL